MMGHLTTGGTVANIEAIWAGRNVKYFPLGLQEALIKEERLAAARGYKVRGFTENHIIPILIFLEHLNCNFSFIMYYYIRFLDF